MQMLLDQFCGVLAAERDVHRELLALSTAKKDVIIKNDIAALDKIVKKEQSLLMRLEDCEKKRRSCVGDLAGRVGRPAEQIVLQDFIDVSDEAGEALLRELYGDLTSLLEQQIQLNDVNKKLVESRLEYINFILEAAASQPNPSHIYGGGAGENKQTRKPNFIDQKV